MKIKFPYNEHLFPVLLTCNHDIDKSFLSKNDKISILINGQMKTIELKNRIIYNNKKLDIAIIEIKKKDRIEENQDLKISGKTVYL